MQEKINILNELKDVGATFLAGADNRNVFIVPDNYFNTLPGNILSHVFIKSLPATNPYKVPENYFKNLPEIILDKVSLPSFDSNEKDIFSVPEGYFDSLADNILKKIKKPVSISVQQELNEISPLLSKIPRTNVYAVPENYFNELDSSILIGNNIKTEAKVISIGSTKRKWLSYAAAACIAAFAFTGGYFYFFGNKPYNNPDSTVAQADVQKEISGLSDDEIADYLKDNNNIAVYTNVGDDDQQQQSMNVQDLLQNVSDEEIQQYLNQDPESGETGGGI